MNEIFLLLWLSDFVGNIHGLGIFLTVIFCMAFPMIWIIFAQTDNKDKTLSMTLRWMPTMLIPMLISLFLPSSTTIKSLAVMQVGQIAISTPLGEKSIKALDAVLDRVIAGSPTEKK